MDQHLKIFLTVAEKQNFSRAAEEHHMTQPAVSQYIRTFEEMIGTRLLERNNKYVRLNKAGEIVYHHGKEILGLYTKMQNLVDDLTNKATGRLCIGASYTFGEYVLPRIISSLQTIYPAIQPEVTIGNTAKISELVATNQLDVGIVEGQFINKKLIMEELAEDSMVVVAAANHPLGKKKGKISKQDLEEETWVVREEGSGTREATEKIFRQLALSPKKLMNFSSTQLIKESVEVGLGISLLSQWTIQKELRNGDLQILDIDGLPLSRNFSIVTNSHFQTKALEVFLSILRNNKLLITL